MFSQYQFYLTQCPAPCVTAWTRKTIWCLMCVVPETAWNALPRSCPHHCKKGFLFLVAIFYMKKYLWKFWRCGESGWWVRFTGLGNLFLQKISHFFSQNIPLSQSPNLSPFSAVAVFVANYKSLVNEIVSIPKIYEKNLNYPMNESLPLCQTGLRRVGRTANLSIRAQLCEQSVPSYSWWLILTYRNTLVLDCNS